jgi:ASPIC/UnbV protein/type IX secretion system substrate protein/VCBS repeat protein
MNRIFKLIFLLNVGFCFGQLSFQDNATSLGVGVSYGVSTWGGGVSFYDFNNDGWDDLTFATTNGVEVLFFENNKDNTFSLIDLGINDIYRTKQVTWVDYDNDGDKDFFATSISGLNKFYRNDGNLSFTDISLTSGLFTTNLYTYGASFGDIDNDGDLDVFIANRDDITENQRSYLYRNDNGFFVDITESAGLSLSNELSFCSAFFDYDNDGDQDLYVANDKLPNINRLYQNDGTGNFTDVSVFSLAGIAIDAMSTTIDDYNNDGWFDIYVTNTPDGNYHLRNNGDGTFTDVAADVGTGFYSIGWGAVFLDADNDADLDLYVSGMTDGTNGNLPSAFYENQGDDTYLIPTSIGFANDTRVSFSNAIGDFNNDGYPDIVVMNDTDNNFLWENTTTNSNNWLKIKLQGVTSNRDGIGSKIEVFTNGKSQYRYTLCGEGYISQNSDTEIFGAGTATNIDYVKVTWLSGVVDILNNVTPNQTLTIVENSTLSSKEFDKNTFIIFPNPTSGIVNIKSTINQDFILTIFDAIGRKISSKAYININKSINVNDLSNGVYFFSFNTEKGEITKKVVIY